MTDHKRVSELFVKACALPAAERAAFLDQACARDAALRSEVEAMLSRDATSGGTASILAPALAAAAAVPGAPPTPSIPSRIGPYRILGLLGQGGMGVIYRAEQREPIRREVALKVIRGGADSAGVVARFEAERQALALMDHPAIARIFDAGTTEDGRPYFVMEHVQGVPITEHCDRHRVETSERLRLLVQVCDGVQHAHQKAVIHRDLKPSNILVSMQDDRTVPKIIDFGVAKALSGRLTDSTLHTELGVMVGTPEYMSPEQAEGTGQDVDTRTDVYSLGVILYELLTGVLPFDSRVLRQAGYLGIQKILRDEEPPTPSQRLSRLSDDESREITLRSGTEPAALGLRLRGDLDWIVMRALEKDRRRRYGSAAELAQDLERYLADDPVLACPPTVRYRARKFIRRHRLAVLAAGGVGLALLLGIIGTTAGLVRARRAEREARREARTSDRVAGFLSGMMGDVDPHRMGSLLVRDLGERAMGHGADSRIAEELSKMSGTDTARRLLDEEIFARAAPSIDKEFAQDPLIAARLHHTLAEVYQQLGMPDAADPPCRSALEVRERLLGPSDPATLRSSLLMGDIRYRQSRFPEAEALRRGTLETSTRVLGAEHPITLASMWALAFVLNAEGNYDEAEDLYRRTLALHQRVLGPEDPQTLGVMNDLGYLHQTRWRYQDADRLHRQVLDIRLRRLGPEHRDTLWSVFNVAWAAESSGDLEQGSRLFTQCLEARRRILGTEHPDTLNTQYMLARVWMRQDRFAEAERLLGAALGSQRRLLGPAHRDTLWSLQLRAVMEYWQDRLPESRRDGEEVLMQFRKSLGDDHPNAVWALHQLRRTCWAGGWLDGVRRLGREMLPGLRQAAARPEPPWAVLTECAFALLDDGHAGKEEAGEALRHAERAVQISESKDSMPLAALALAYDTLGDASRAVEAQKKAISNLEPPERRRRAYMESQLARYGAHR